MVDLHILSLNNTTENLTEHLSPEIISEQQRSKPIVALELQHEGGSHRLNALIDPASYNDRADETEIISYIAKPIATFILDKYPTSLITCTCKPATTCTAAGCFTSNKCLKIKCNLSDDKARIDNVEIAFRVVETLGSNEIIIGLSDVRKHDLTKIFRHIYTEQQRTYTDELPQTDNLSAHKLDNGVDATASSTSGVEGGPSLFLREVESSRRSIIDQRQQADLVWRGGRRRRVPTRTSDRLARRKPDFSCQAEEGSQPSELKSMSTLELHVAEMIEGNVYNKSQFLQPEDDTDNIDDFVEDTPYDKMFTNAHNEEYSTEQNTDQNTEPNAQEKINKILDSVKDEEMKNLLKQWIYRYSNVFNDELNEKAASVDPFKLELNPDSNWEEAATNKAPPRWQMLAKQKEVHRFVKLALKLKLIRKSQARAWSQVLLTKKPNGKWRFCIDFRSLNLNTKSIGWPIPNIKQVLERIAKSGAKYFAVLDLTQGYYQMLIDEASRYLTAFRTAFGIFEWNRLPMGLKGAGSYYQSHMQNTVLADLLYTICESYLDDILVYGKTKEELSRNIELVVARLQKFGMTINPDKVKIQMNEVEYVGHVIDQYGISFSDEKLERVLEFKTPTLDREMKTFLGLISQFREHVPNFADLAAPCQDMLIAYKKKFPKKLKWTDELTENFNKLKLAVANCTKLYFLDDKLPVFLHTDASILGIGSYLFQVQDEKQIPIRFINKQLNKTERNWNIVEKEMYAIFYSFMKLEHLLRDRHFTLRTDSKILSHMNVDHKEKVKRWKLAIQHFDFDVEHISGKLNKEADALSRLIPLPEHTELHVLEQTETVPTHKSLKQHIYQKIKSVHPGEKGIFGHGGVQRTLDLLLRKQDRWKGMRNDVNTFIKNCPCCQKMQRLKPRIHTIPYTLAFYRPMQRICVDAIGPIHIGNQEYKHILVFIDAFSRYVRLYPLKSVNSEECLHAFNHWVADFGIPSELVSDNAAYFVSDLIESFLENAGLEHATIHPYSHEENGIVERANQEVIRHLTAMISDRDIRHNWPKYLPFVQRILNTSVKSTTKVTPTELIFGTSVNHDSQFLRKPEPAESDKTHHEAINELLSVQEKLITIAQNNQYEHDIYVVSQRSKDQPHTIHFPINSYVLVNYETQKSSKLHTVKHGPYRVINHIGTVYTVENLVTNKHMDFHVTLLTEYKNDKQNTNIDRVAKLDDEFADVATVINHKFVPSTSTKKTDMQFLMTWDNDPEPKWYRYNTSLGQNEIIHEYLDKEHLRKFIPKKFTFPNDHPEEIARKQLKRAREENNPRRNVARKPK